MADKKKSDQAQDLSVLSLGELKSELGKSVDQRAKLEFQHRIAPLKNPMELGGVRRRIARLQTFLRLKEAAK